MTAIQDALLSIKILFYYYYFSIFSAPSHIADRKDCRTKLIIPSPSSHTTTVFLNPTVLLLSLPPRYWDVLVFIHVHDLSFHGEKKEHDEIQE